MVHPFTRSEFYGPFREGHGLTGIAYFRAGNIEEAIDALELSLANGGGEWDALDLYFLAMCHHQRAAHDQARECMARAKVWHERHAKKLPSSTQAELTRFREEAVQHLGPPGTVERQEGLPENE